MISKGSLSLSEMFEKRGAQHQTAEAIEVEASLLIRWKRGEQKPDSRYRALLEDKLGIPWRSWDELAEASVEPTGSAAQ
jgi:transcriptional regulator with XRE-family HTH domain